jgi:hypothetical protein
MRRHRVSHMHTRYEMYICNSYSACVQHQVLAYKTHVRQKEATRVRPCGAARSVAAASHSAHCVPLALQLQPARVQSMVYFEAAFLLRQEFNGWKKLGSGITGAAPAAQAAVHSPQNSLGWSDSELERRQAKVEVLCWSFRVHTHTQTHQAPDEGIVALPHGGLAQEGVHVAPLHVEHHHAAALAPLWVVIPAWLSCCPVELLRLAAAAAAAAAASAAPVAVGYSVLAPAASPCSAALWQGSDLNLDIRCTIERDRFESGVC